MATIIRSDNGPSTGATKRSDAAVSFLERVRSWGNKPGTVTHHVKSQPTLKLGQAANLTCYMMGQKLDVAISVTEKGVHLKSEPAHIDFFMCADQLVSLLVENSTHGQTSRVMIELKQHHLSVSQKKLSSALAQLGITT